MHGMSNVKQRKTLTSVSTFRDPDTWILKRSSHNTPSNPVV